MCKHTPRVTFHPNKMRSDDSSNPNQALKRSRNNRMQRSSPPSKTKITKTEQRRAMDNDPRNKSPLDPAGSPVTNNNHFQRNPVSPKSCDRVSCPKPTTPSKFPAAMSPSKLLNNYAGSKFSDPPSPKLLPKPPTSWMVNKENENFVSGKGSCVQMTNVLKVILNVQA